MGISSYSVSASSNTTVGGISITEGMQRSEVNDAIRALMADLAQFYRETPRPLTLEKYGGGPDKTATQNSAAWTSLLADLGTSGRVHFHQGTYSFLNTVTLPASTTEIVITGEGKGKTLLYQSDSTKDVMAVPSAATGNTLVIRDLEFVGPGYAAGTTRGFYCPDDTTDFPQIVFDGVGLSEIPGDGIYIGNGFNMLFKNVDADNIGGHGISAYGNSTLFQSCYMRRIRTAGKAGYRVPTGTITFLACNGLVSGDYWLDAGKSTVDGDASDSYAFVDLIGCNLEDFTVAGARIRNGGVSVRLGTSIVGPSTGTTFKGILIRHGNMTGVLDDSAVFTTNGGTYANGYAVHVTNGGYPFAMVLGYPNAGHDQFTYWDDTAAATRTISTIKQGVVVSGRYGVAMKDIYSNGIFGSIGTIGYITGAGGAVTQGTSRTTGVTLNTICGAITLVSAAGSASWQSFTVTNSQVAATDTIIVNQKSGTDLNMIHVTAVGAGSFKITFATTGGTTVEQPVFNFSVIKAVAA